MVCIKRSESERKTITGTIMWYARGRYRCNETTIPTALFGVRARVLRHGIQRRTLPGVWHATMTTSIRISDDDHAAAKSEAEEKDMSIKNVIHEWRLMAEFQERDRDGA